MMMIMTMTPVKASCLCNRCNLCNRCDLSTDFHTNISYDNGIMLFGLVWCEHAKCWVLLGNEFRVYRYSSSMRTLSNVWNQQRLAGWFHTHPEMTFRRTSHKLPGWSRSLTVHGLLSSIDDGDESIRMATVATAEGLMDLWWWWWWCMGYRTFSLPRANSLPAAEIPIGSGNFASCKFCSL